MNSTLQTEEHRLSQVTEALGSMLSHTSGRLIPEECGSWRALVPKQVPEDLTTPQNLSP